MRSIIKLRNQHRRDAGRDTGMMHGINRVWSGQIAIAGAGESQLLELPHFLGDQDTQTANGSLIFMMDLDALDGSNGMG